MMKSLALKVWIHCWTQSVPPALAGGYVVDPLGSKSCACTHPLPQVVLTVSKSGSDFGDSDENEYE